MIIKKMTALLALGMVCWLGNAQKAGTALASNSVEFYRSGQQIDSRSPDGKSVVSALPPVNDDANPRVVVRSKGQTLSLGDLERSARVYWRPDSRMAAISDYAYSNHSRVMLVRVQPQLRKVKIIDSVIKQRVLREFHTAGFVHYWPYVQGWTADGRLLVVACANGMAPRAHLGAPLVEFERGYLVDPDKLTITTELSIKEYVKLAGKDTCQ